MRVSHDQIEKAIRDVFGIREYEPGQVLLMPIEPPRDWGVSTNICFLAASHFAAEEIAFRTEGLSKKEAKQISAQVKKETSEELARELAKELNELRLADPKAMEFVARIEAEGAYVNFYYDAAALTAYVVETVITKGEEYGHGDPTGRRIMVEYAQPNTHKDFHVGHLRNASIGQAIANLLEFAGNDVLKATYIGDIGLHVAYAMWRHKHRNDPEWTNDEMWRHVFKPILDPRSYWGEAYKVARQIGNELKRLNSEGRTVSEELAARNKKFESEIRLWLKNWEDNEPSVRREWQESRDQCIHGGNLDHMQVEGFLSHVFPDLRINFTNEPDCIFYESTIEDTKLGQKTAEELKQLGIAVIDDSDEYKGALYVDFEQHLDKFPEDQRKKIKKLGKMTILRSDGTSLYQTKELGLAKYKFDMVQEKFGEPLDESLYVVGAEQKLYFDQVFAILHLWGFPNADNCKHIAYELVVLPEGKMSSREGTIVSYRDLRDEAVGRAIRVAKEKGIGAKDDSGAIDEKKAAAIAYDVAIAAIKFAMLQVTGNQKIVFDFEQALSFSGRAAPYLQYAYARAGKLVDEEMSGEEITSRDSGAAVPGRQDIQPAREGLDKYRHRLPHWRMPGSTYFVTWRLNPAQKILSEPERDLVADAIMHFDHERYEVFGYVLMDDHVHVVVRPFDNYPLETVIHTWKSFTANRLQRVHKRTGSIWQDEYMDRIVRDEDELWEKLEYIQYNPLKRWPEVGAYKWLYLFTAGRDARPTENMNNSVNTTESPPGYDLHPSEIALARLLEQFPATCRDAAKACEPATVCSYLYSLATAFSDFYRDCRVLNAAPVEKAFRQALTAAFRRVLKTGFKILALPLPEEM